MLLRASRLGRCRIQRLAICPYLVVRGVRRKQQAVLAALGASVRLRRLAQLKVFVRGIILCDADAEDSALPDARSIEQSLTYGSGALCFFVFAGSTEDLDDDKRSLRGFQRHLARWHNRPREFNDDPRAAHSGPWPASLDCYSVPSSRGAVGFRFLRNVRAFFRLRRTNEASSVVGVSWHVEQAFQRGLSVGSCAALHGHCCGLRRLRPTRCNPG